MTIKYSYNSRTKNKINIIPIISLLQRALHFLRHGPALVVRRREALPPVKRALQRAHIPRADPLVVPAIVAPQQHGRIVHIAAAAVGQKGGSGV
jgi:hypothetical protein